MVTGSVVIGEGSGYLGTIERVIDGDTIAVLCDLTPLLGIEVSVRQILRLHGVDAPERHSAEGRAATDWLEQLIEAHAWRCLVAVRKVDKFGGRFLADVWLAGDSALLAQRIIAAGHGRPYSGGPRPKKGQL